jgi:hypothetical protein
VEQVAHAFTPAPAGLERGDRARGRDHPGPGRPHHASDQQRAAPQQDARGKGPEGRQSGPETRNQQSGGHPQKGRDRQGRVPHREPAHEAEAREHPPAWRRGVAVESTEADEEGVSGDEGHEEVGGRAGGGHERHVGCAPCGQEGPGPARAPAPGPTHPASEEAHQDHEQERAGELVESVDGVGIPQGEARSEKVRVEGSVVWLIPEGGRELAPKNVAPHEQQDRVVVRNREGPGDPVQGATNGREGHDEGGGGKQAARSRAHENQSVPDLTTSVTPLSLDR